MMVLPDEALLTAAWIVLQAVAADIQSLVSLPVVPLTYHVVAAAAGCTAMMTKPRKVGRQARAADRKNPSTFVFIFIVTPLWQAVGFRCGWHGEVSARRARRSLLGGN